MRYSSTRPATVHRRRERVEAARVGRVAVAVVVVVVMVFVVAWARIETSQLLLRLRARREAETRRRWQGRTSRHDAHRGRYPVTSLWWGTGCPNDECLLPLVLHGVGIGEKFCWEAAKLGAGDGARTRDALLGRQIL